MSRSGRDAQLTTSQIIESFSFTGLQGKIAMHEPEVEFVVFEDCTCSPSTQC